MNDPKYIVVHHSLTPDGLLKDFEAIRRYHIEVNGWKDIGYHYVVEKVGKDWTIGIGRSESEEGAHCKEAGMNRQSLGICLVGNFDAGPPPIQGLYMLKSLCFRICMDYGIPAQNIIGHRDAGLMAGFDWRITGSTGVRQFKSCPGVFFPLESFRQLVAEDIDRSGSFKTQNPPPEVMI